MYGFSFFPASSSASFEINEWARSAFDEKLLVFFSPQCCHHEGPVRFYEGKVFSFFILLIGLIWSGRFCEQSFFLLFCSGLIISHRTASIQESAAESEAALMVMLCL